MRFPFRPLSAAFDLVTAFFRLTDSTADRNAPLARTNNLNGTGELAWGDISGNTALLWAMSSNQGIQAFTVVVPEPSVIAMFLTGAGMVGVSMIRRRKP